MTTQDPGPFPRAAPTPRAEDASEIDGAANILEQLLLDHGRAVDRAQIRRIVREVVNAFPGEASQRWWRWIGEAGTNLGLTCKVVDCTPGELRELARQGARLILHVDGPDPWRAVTGTQGRKFRLAHAFSEIASEWGDAARLIQLAGNPKKHDVLRCVIVDTWGADADPSHAEPGETTPLARLWGLLRPERTDMLIVIVFSLVAALLTLATPIAVESLVNTVAFGRLFQPLAVLTLVLLAFLVFSAAIRVLQTYVVEIVQCRLFARVTADLAFRLPRIRAESVDGTYMPELVNRFFDVVTVQKVAAKLLLDGLLLVLSTVVGMAVLALYHPWLLGFDVMLLGMLAFAIFILGRGAVPTAIKESKHKYHTAAWLEDLARCAVAFKFDGGAEFALERADQLTYEYLSARKKHFRVLLRQIVFALAMQAVASTILLGIGGWLVMTGGLTLGQLVAAELIVTVVVGSLAKLGKYMESYYDLLASVDKLGMLFDLPIEEQGGVLHRFPPAPSSLTVHDVGYEFSGGASVLESVGMTIPSGDRIALTGSGKSVLMDLMFGLRSPTHGHLSLDGIDPRDLRPDFLRRRVSLVRDVEVFHGSVAENVHLARPEVTADAVRDALSLVGLLDGVLRLPDGIETILTSAGRPLTDNQLRRLMLARAMVGRPGLLLIDGVLDTLPDEDTEELMRMVCDPRQSWTLVIVTSRKSLHQYCKRVLDLDSDGRLSNASFDVPDDTGGNR